MMPGEERPMVTLGQAQHLCFMHKMPKASTQLFHANLLYATPLLNIYFLLSSLRESSQIYMKNQGPIFQDIVG